MKFHLFIWYFGLNIFTFCLHGLECHEIHSFSPTVLIVNHLNYLRYDYFSNPSSLPTSSITDNYLTYESNESILNNRTTTNFTNSILNQLNQQNENIENNNLDINLPNALHSNEYPGEYPSIYLNHFETTVILDGLNTRVVNTTTDSTQTNDLNTNKNYTELNLHNLNVSINQNDRLTNINLEASRNQERINDETFHETVFNSIDDLGNLIENNEDNLDSTFNLFNYISDDQNHNNQMNENQYLHQISTTDSFMPVELNNVSDSFQAIDDNFNKINLKTEKDFNNNENKSNEKDEHFDYQNFLDTNNSIINSNDFELASNTNFDTNDENYLASSSLFSESNSRLFQDNLNDYILSDYVLDEDLQLICFSNNSTNALPSLNDVDNFEVVSLVNINENFIPNNEDNIEISSDSALSSMSSSDCVDSSSENSYQCNDKSKRKLNNNRKKKLISSLNNNETLQVNYKTNINNEKDNFSNEMQTDLSYSFDSFTRNNNFSNEELLLLDENNFERNERNNLILNSNDNLNNNMIENIMHNHTYFKSNINNYNSKMKNICSNTGLSKSVTKSSDSYSFSSSSSYNSSNSDEKESTSSLMFSNSLRRNQRSQSNYRIRENSLDTMSMTSEIYSEDDKALSRDEKKAKDLQIPISVQEIINMPIDEFNDCLSHHELNEQQLILIRDIRRRGKNKVAAQNCRKRKLNQIVSLQHEVNHLHSQKNSLLANFDKWIQLQDLAKMKYKKLYDFIFDRSATNLAILNELQFNFQSRNNSEGSDGAIGGLNNMNFDEQGQNQLNNRSSTNDLLILKNLKLSSNVSSEHNKVSSNYKKALVMN